MRQKSIATYATTALLGLGLLLGATGCKESERDRVLMYNKGNYLGPADQKLDDGAVRDLQNRVRHQIAA